MSDNYWSKRVANEAEKLAAKAEALRNMGVAYEGQYINSFDGDYYVEKVLKPSGIRAAYRELDGHSTAYVELYEQFGDNVAAVKRGRPIDVLLKLVTQRPELLADVAALINDD